MPDRDCGGCRGVGRHWRWCPRVVGIGASLRGRMSAEAESLGDRIGANNPGAANHAYAAAGLLREEANEMARAYQEQHGTSH